MRRSGLLRFLRPTSLGYALVDARKWVALALVLALALAASACGYSALYAGAPPSRLHVVLVRTLIADVVASDEVVAGLREELARAGALAGGDAYPRIEVEVLRADETSEGIAAGSSGPVSRATDIGLAARAWVVRAPGAPPESDTGDLRDQETIAVDEMATGPDPRASAFHTADALRAAARRLGRRLAYKVTGQPGSSDDDIQSR
jgi:hypothetical protein